MVKKHTRQMPKGAQIAFAKAWLEGQGIAAETVDVAALIDGSLSYEENIKNLKRELKLGKRRMATRTMTAAECDISIGNYQEGYNSGEIKRACQCGDPDACDELARKAAKKKPEAKPVKKAKKIVPPPVKKVKPKPEPKKKPGQKKVKPTIKGTVLTKKQRDHIKNFGYVNISRGGKKYRITPAKVKRGGILK